MCPNGLFLGSMLGSKSVFGSTHVVEQLSFSMNPSILTFKFDLILGSFLTFWGINGQNRIKKIVGHVTKAGQLISKPLNYLYFLGCI